jgi:hypothetical protein
MMASASTNSSACAKAATPSCRAKAPLPRHPGEHPGRPPAARGRQRQALPGHSPEEETPA